MTKAELQSALAAAARTDKKTAGLFLDALNAIAYKAAKKNGEFVVPGFGKLVKQKRKARTGLNPKTQQTRLTLYRCTSPERPRASSLMRWPVPSISK
jgi:DNA-binding protein HU-beta